LNHKRRPTDFYKENPVPAHDKTSVDRPAGATPLLNTHFEVIFDGLPALGFCSVEGIEAVVEENVSASTRKGSVKERPARLVLQRAATGSRDLWEWYAAARDGNDVRRSGRIAIRDPGGEGVILQVSLQDARPVRWCLSRLDALQPEVLVEEIELLVDTIDLD
jgi:phage tail-like protein